MVVFASSVSMPCQVKRPRISGKTSYSVDALASELQVEVPMLTNNRDLSKGDEILVFKADDGKPKAPVRALRIQVGSLMKRQAMAAQSSKKR